MLDTLDAIVLQSGAYLLSRYNDGFFAAKMTCAQLRSVCTRQTPARRKSVVLVVNDSEHAYLSHFASNRILCFQVQIHNVYEMNESSQTFCRLLRTVLLPCFISQSEAE